jgi:protein phosphatase
MSSSPTDRYLWAADPQAAWIPTNKLVEDRYHVLAPQLWLDTKSSEQPEALWPLPDRARPYTKLSRYRLHIPQLYGFCSLGRAGQKSVDIPLLDNIPIDAQGQLLPALVDRWAPATALAQIHWLWQIIELWSPLAEIGVGYSLLVADNLRVQGWRLRLCELLPDSLNPGGRSTAVGLANFWSILLDTAQPELQAGLGALVAQMQIGKLAVADLAGAVNEALLTQAASFPLGVTVVGGSDSGRNLHNEDSYYPNPSNGQIPVPGLAMVCDGVAGHEGGEVASQMAVQSIALQLQTLVAEVATAAAPSHPLQVFEHLQAVVRVANNAIADRNDRQGRTDRRRMATTLVAALHLPQVVVDRAGNRGHSHEIYLAHVGDSRAYWITRQGCQPLTVDDDVAQREISQGKSMPWQAQGRIDAGALTQALGMRSGDSLQPFVQRLMVLEDGVLLLCSDGLSDRQLVEKSWSNYVPPVLGGELTLGEAVTAWLELGRTENGHDNLSLVLVHCQVTPSDAAAAPSPARLSPAQRPRLRWLPWSLCLGGLVLASIGGYGIWRYSQRPPLATPPPQIAPVPSLPAVPAP